MGYLSMFRRTEPVLQSCRHLCLVLRPRVFEEEHNVCRRCMGIPTSS